MTDYRILKLRSGEEIMAVVSGKTSSEIILNRPMQLRLTTLHDPITGNIVKENWIMRNWIPNTNQNNCSIPLDYIVYSVEPNDESIFQYELEKEIEDNPPKKKAVSSEGSSLVLEQLFKQLGLDLPPENESLEGKSPPPNADMLQNFVMMNFTMSKEMFAKLMEEGIFDGEEIPIDDFGFDEDEDLDRDPESEDWGNQWSDWSDDINDYFKED